MTINITPTTAEVQEEASQASSTGKAQQHRASWELVPFSRPKSTLSAARRETDKRAEDEEEQQQQRAIWRVLQSGFLDFIHGSPVQTQHIFASLIARNVQAHIAHTPRLLLPAPSNVLGEKVPASTGFRSLPPACAPLQLPAVEEQQPEWPQHGLRSALVTASEPCFGIPDSHVDVSTSSADSSCQGGQELTVEDAPRSASWSGPGCQGNSGALPSRKWSAFVPRCLDMGVTCRRGARSTMEDFAFALPLLPPQDSSQGCWFQRAACFGVFDGHGGHEVAESLSVATPRGIQTHVTRIAEEGAHPLGEVLLGHEAVLRQGHTAHHRTRHHHSRAHTWHHHSTHHHQHQHRSSLHHHQGQQHKGNGRVATHHRHPAASVGSPRRQSAPSAAADTSPTAHTGGSGRAWGLPPLPTGSPPQQHQQQGADHLAPRAPGQGPAGRAWRALDLSTSPPPPSLSTSPPSPRHSLPLPSTSPTSPSSSLSWRRPPPPVPAPGPGSPPAVIPALVPLSSSPPQQPQRQVSGELLGEGEGGEGDAQAPAPHSRDPGSTALVATVIDGVMHVAHVGDCRLLLAELVTHEAGGQQVQASSSGDGSGRMRRDSSSSGLLGGLGGSGRVVARRVTQDHRPSEHPAEAQRLAALAVPVSPEGYVGGALAVSRSIGDFSAKLELGEGAILSEPELHTVELGPDILFAVAVTDGVTDALDDEAIISQVCRYLNDRGRDQQLKGAGHAARELVEYALGTGKCHDNATAVVCVFSPDPPPLPPRPRLFGRSVSAATVSALAPAASASPRELDRSLPALAAGPALPLVPAAPGGAGTGGGAE